MENEEKSGEENAEVMTDEVQNSQCFNGSPAKPNLKNHSFIHTAEEPYDSTDPEYNVRPRQSSQITEHRQHQEHINNMILPHDFETLKLTTLLKLNPGILNYVPDIGKPGEIDFILPELSDEKKSSTVNSGDFWTKKPFHQQD